MPVNRRDFVCGCSAAIAALAGARFNSLVFGQPNPGDHPILVNVFLRGGMDGLNFMMPTTNGDRGFYEAARSSLQVPVGEALALPGGFGLHPSADGLHGLFQDGRLALVHACGLQTVQTRSHFDAMEYIELGTPGAQSISTGWLTRHLNTTPGLPPQVVLPSVAIGSLEPTSLQGSSITANIGDIDDFNLDQGPWDWRSAHRTSLRRLLGNGSTQTHVRALDALDSADIIELSVSGGYTPANGAQYPNNSLGDAMKSVAQLVKLDLGLRVATIDFGGWDTHNGQGNGSGGQFSSLVGSLSDAMTALYTDLDGPGNPNDASRLTIVVQSEFGRRLFENDDDGTDHGYGNLMMVLGKEVNGGQLYGTWPGLASHQLFEGDDLMVTTDYRRVMSEILVRRFGNSAIDTVFPG
ncbi:MAG: DUF1501 domain-containing protein [Acidobacteria bacterium]|nr:MAG: DUF1501 domain-containing protein [Acidobacteriota bacterium]